MRRAGLEPDPRRDQHFLVDPSLLRAVVRDAGVTPDDAILEIGTGAGTLTRALAERARCVVTIDLDSSLVAFARRELEGCENVRFLCGDALDGRELAPDLRREVAELGSFLWVSNLPYSVATPLIGAVLEGGTSWRRAHLLVQREVAERMAAEKGTRSYGPLSLLVSYWAHTRLGRRVAPGAFLPPPRVESRFVALEPRSGSEASPELYHSYRWWVLALFRHRRKQLEGIIRALALPGIEPRSVVACLAADPKTRPERISRDQFVRLAEAIPAPFRRPGPDLPA